MPQTPSELDHTALELADSIQMMITGLAYYPYTYAKVRFSPHLANQSEVNLFAYPSPDLQLRYLAPQSFPSYSCPPPRRAIQLTPLRMILTNFCNIISSE